MNVQPAGISDIFVPMYMDYEGCPFWKMILKDR